MIKNLPLILEKITNANFLFAVRKLYSDNQQLIIDNFEVCTLMM